MTAPHDKRFLLPGDPGWGKHEGKDDELRQNGASPGATTSVLTNNRPLRENGSPRRPVDSVQAEESPREQARQERGSATVRAGCIGRGNVGKTALFRALTDGPIGDFLPSGLHVDAGDPREVAQMIRQSEETQKLLHLAGLPPTLVASQMRYYLYEGAEQRAAYYMHEVIGQILTHTLPDSLAQEQILYDEYLLHLVNAEVLWTVVPCPPRNPDAHERRRYANDLRITMAYLREALRLRSMEQPVAVALVLSKIDTLFPSAAEARKALTDQVLYRALGPLVDLIETSARVSEAAIIPVTAFGFGSAIVQENGGQREGTVPETANEPFGAEPVWIVREGTEALSYNLDALFVWTLLKGLRGLAATDNETQDTDARRICEMLEKDLEAAKPWILPIKHGVKTGAGK